MSTSDPPTESSRYRHLLPRYRRYAPEYDRAWGRYSSATLGKVVELLDEYAPEGRSLLDVGCGTGLLAAMLRPRYPELAITGIDLSEAMLDKARQRFASDALTDWRIAQAESLPIDDASFDVVVSANAFHLIVDPDAALAEFRRVLRSRGTLIIVDWNRAYPTIKLLAMAYPLVDRHPRRIAPLRSVAARIRAAGFEVIDQQPFNATPFWGMGAVVARRGSGSS